MGLAPAYAAPGHEVAPDGKGLPRLMDDGEERLDFCQLVGRLRDRQPQAVGRKRARRHDPGLDEVLRGHQRPIAALREPPDGFLRYRGERVSRHEKPDQDVRIEEAVDRRYRSS